MTFSMLSMPETLVFIEEDTTPPLAVTTLLLSKTLVFHVIGHDDGAWAMSAATYQYL